MSRSPFDNCSVGGEQCPLGWKEEAVGGCEILNFGPCRRHTLMHFHRRQRRDGESSQSKLTGADLPEMDFDIFQGREDRACEEVLGEDESSRPMESLDDVKQFYVDSIKRMGKCPLNGNCACSKYRGTL